jgi:predicted AlkP superfamily pyrophosphatase or phosphodiesterase
MRLRTIGQAKPPAPPVLALGAILAVCAVAQPAPHRAVLMVSIDGLRPDYVLGSAHAEIKVPNLRRIAHDGVSATGVRGVLPTVTYSSHTTLVTGVYPAKHGIETNHPFEPVEKDPNAWFWFTEDIRVPTLWDAAAKSGYVVASVAWPVTVGAKSIRYNLPEYAGTRTPQDLKMVRALAGPELMAELGERAGAFLTDVNQAIERDWSRTRYAIELIRQKHANFVTIHLAAADHAQHSHGPFSAEAVAAVEEIDKMIGQLTDAIRSADANAAVCVVSDHGFAKVDHMFKLDAALKRAGLVRPNSWEAAGWVSGGSAAIVLRNPNDAGMRAKVRQALDALAADPANGIVRVLDPPEIARMGGTARAAFWLDMRPGFAFSTALDGPLATTVSTRGTHGYTPDHDEMNSSFFLSGKGVRKNADLGIIDMRAIAPTLARLLGASFPSAEQPALSIAVEAGAGKR